MLCKHPVASRCVLSNLENESGIAFTRDLIPFFSAVCIDVSYWTSATEKMIQITHSFPKFQRISLVAEIK